MSLTLLPTFDATKTVTSRRQRFDFTPASGTAVKISCKSIDLGGKLTTAILKQPGADDINRDVAEVPLDAEDLITLKDIEEIDVVLTLLGGLNALKVGTGIAYVKDPRDATSVVKYSVTGPAGAAFACTIKRPDDALTMGGADFSKTSLIVRNISGHALAVNSAAAAPDTVT